MPPAALVAIARRLADLLAEEGPRSPWICIWRPSLDQAAAWRSLRAAEARFGPVVLGEPIAGDGDAVSDVAAPGRSRRRRPEPGAGRHRAALQTVAFVPVTLETPPDAF